MEILRDVLRELHKMFLADARLTAAVLVLAALAAGLAGLGLHGPVLGLLLLLGALGILVVAILVPPRSR